MLQIFIPKLNYRFICYFDGSIQDFIQKDTRRAIIDFKPVTHERTISFFTFPIHEPYEQQLSHCGID